MGSKNVTLRVDASLYEKFRKYCKRKGLIISRQFEIFMENELKKNKQRDKYGKANR